MATYFVGDIQGCLDDLLALLKEAQFNPACDQLWLTGDLVARGPKSLETLRYVKSLGNAAVTVLGNHDLHLLAVAEGFAKLKKIDKVAPILAAPDRDELLSWLRNQPLLAKHPEYDLLMVHAGISPQWSQTEAVMLAQEVEAVLQGEGYRDLLAHMYGNQPSHWDQHLSGIDRYRFIINCFTRMRFCYLDGSLDFDNKLQPSTNDNPNQKPWYEIEGEHLKQATVIFGHWAALMGESSHAKAIALDTGCVWGNSLTMIRWEDKKLFSRPCPVYAT